MAQHTKNNLNAPARGTYPSEDDLRTKKSEATYSDIEHGLDGVRLQVVSSSLIGPFPSQDLRLGPGRDTRYSPVQAGLGLVT